MELGIRGFSYNKELLFLTKPTVTSFFGNILGRKATFESYYNVKIKKDFVYWIEKILKLFRKTTETNWGPLTPQKKNSFSLFLVLFILVSLRNCKKYIHPHKFPSKSLLNLLKAPYMYVTYRTFFIKTFAEIQGKKSQMKRRNMLNMSY